MDQIVPSSITPPQAEYNSPPKTKVTNYWKIICFILTPIIFLLIFVLITSQNQPYSKSNTSINEKTTETTSTIPSPQLCNKSNKKYTPLNIEAWEQFSDPRFNFTFKYPKNWSFNINKEDLTVATGNYPNNCSKCSLEEKNNFYAFSIKKLEDQNPQTQINNAKEYLYRAWLKYNEETKLANEKCLAQTGKPCPPSIPGFTLEYKQEADQLFKNSNASAAEIYPYPFFAGEMGGYPCGYPVSVSDFDLVENEYIVIDKNYVVYQINIISPGYPNQENQQQADITGHPIIDIIKSLKLITS